MYSTQKIKMKKFDIDIILSYNKSEEIKNEQHRCELRQNIQIYRWMNMNIFRAPYEQSEWTYNILLPRFSTSNPSFFGLNMSYFFPQYSSAPLTQLILCTLHVIRQQPQLHVSLHVPLPQRRMQGQGLNCISCIIISPEMDYDKN